MNDNNHSTDKSLVLSAGHSLATVRSDLVKRGLSLITRDEKIVLIVDDDPHLPWIIKDGLEKYNELFQVIVAQDGQIAINILEKHPISLVVTNIHMPRISGFELLAYIKENYPDIPVIIMTADGGPERENQTYQIGADEFIDKPFMLEELAKKIIVNLGKKSFNNQKSVNAWFFFGVCYRKLDRWQEAIKAFEQAIKLNPDYAETHLYLGFTYLNIGDKGSALEEYKILKTLDPKRAEQLSNFIDK